MRSRHKLRKNYKVFQYKNPRQQLLLISNYNRRFEFVYFIFFRKILKYFLKKSRRRRTNFYCKFCLVSNYWLSKKPQNSRMGKGKGSFLRKCFLIKKNQPILIVRGINTIYLYKIKKLLEKKLNFTFSIQTNFVQSRNTISHRQHNFSRAHSIKKI